MTRLVLALEPRVEDRIVAELIDRGHEIVARVDSARDVLAACDSAAETGAEVALVGGSTSRLTQALVAGCDERGARLIVLAGSEFERRHAAELGLFDVLDASADCDEIEALMAAGAVPARLDGRTGTGSSSGTVVAVWGPAGAPGRTTIAVNVAAELAGYGHSVVLVDADCYGGAVCPALGLLDEAPGFAAACRLSAAGGFSRAEFERVAQRYVSPRGAFRVLGGLGRASRWPELTTERVTATLTACAGWADFVVVDAGFCLESDEEISSDLFAPRRNAATLAALRAADRVITVGLADPVGLSRLLRGYVELVDAVPGVRSHVVVNRVRASAVGIGPFAQVSSTLARFGSIHADALLPDDPTGCDAALLTGRTLRDAAAKSPVRTGIRALVESVLLPEPEAAPAKRLRRRRRRDRADAAVPV
jgi:ATPases involved in chromosome partitioning